MKVNWIADGLSRIRNGCMRNKKYVVVRGSKVFLSILEVLEKERYIDGYQMYSDGSSLKGGEVSSVQLKAIKQPCVVKLRYYGKKPVITELRVVSKPSLRKYFGSDDMIKFHRVYGSAVVSTSSGIISSREACERNLGGEVLCEVR